MQPTHQIVTMQAGVTKNSQSPMWRCTTKDGERVNVFKHSDPAKDSSLLFAEAGYLPEMDRLITGEELTWNNHPIAVSMRKNGQWWEIIAVTPRLADSEPDPQYVPDLPLYRAKVQDWAYSILTPELPVAFWDTETTGTDRDDEIVSIAAVDQCGKMLINTLIRPTNPQRLTEVRRGTAVVDIHGITPEQVLTAPTFRDIYPHLRDALAGKLWVIYNAPYDTHMLEQDCLRHGLPLIASLGVSCAMENFSQFYGEWSPVYRKFVAKKLDFAAEELRIAVDNAHDALADTLTTLEVVKGMRSQ